jgi:hypothetical protein
VLFYIIGYNDTPMFCEAHSLHYQPEVLSENATRYPELMKPLTSRENEQIQLIKERLIQLPLVFCSHEPVMKIDPHNIHQEDRTSNTYTLDRSLGLDTCVFLHWGIPDLYYGQYMHLVDPNLLFHPYTVVTPDDIVTIADRRYSVPVTKLSQRIRTNIQRKYFDKMISGTQWFELISRKILRKIRKETFISLRYHDFGEIKFFGSIDSHQILGNINGRNNIEKKYYPLLYNLGFGVDAVELARREQLLHDRRITDPTPEEIGINYEAFLHSWDTVLDV